MFLIFADIVQDLLQRNHLELLKFTGSSYQEVLEIQRAVGKAIVPKVQTVSTDFSVQKCWVMQNIWTLLKSC